MRGRRKRGPAGNLERVLRKLALIALACAAGLVSAPAQARAAQCGLPDAKPLWMDYAEGSVTFRSQLFGRPGIIAATSGIAVSSGLRSQGAQTIFFELKLGAWVGTTAAPADPATIPASVNKLLAEATQASGCSTPLMGFNEMNGAGTTTPWSVTNGRYRANVLALVQGLAARGARPFLLVNSPPYVGGAAADWWHQLAQVSDIVPEVYFNAPMIAKLGPVLGSRRMRVAYRRAIAAYTAIGIPVSRLGFVIGFQSGPGTGGREGLKPTSAWLEFVKLQTLAAKQVASELGVATVWSWGWGTYSAAGADPDKPAAACVYLWVRSPSLCDGTSAAGSGFNASLTEGQIDLPTGVQCTLDTARLASASIQAVGAVTGDRDLATSALFERLVESAKAPIDRARILDAEQAVIEVRFGGRRAAYVAALVAAHATLDVARGVIADELRRYDIQQALHAPVPTAAQIASFYASYPDVLTRPVVAFPVPSWLGQSFAGIALEPNAPSQAFEVPLGWATEVADAGGRYAIAPLDGPLPLSAVPLEEAQPAIAAFLTSLARRDGFDAWTTSSQDSALNRILCLGDDLPGVADVRLSDYLPFLELAS